MGLIRDMDTVLFPVATSLIQPMEQGILLGWGYLVRRTARLEECPSQTPIRRAALNPYRTVRHGRPFGEQCSILFAQSRVQGRDPPVFSAGNTGKSLITYSSIRRRISLDKTTRVLPLKVLPFVDQNSKRRSAAGLVHLLEIVWVSGFCARDWDSGWS